MFFFFSLLLFCWFSILDGAAGVNNKYTIALHPDHLETISFVTLLVSVVSAGIVVPLSGFKYTKPYAIALSVLYFLFLLLGILAAANVINW